MGADDDTESESLASMSGLEAGSKQTPPAPGFPDFVPASDGRRRGGAGRAGPPRGGGAPAAARGGAAGSGGDAAGAAMGDGARRWGPPPTAEEAPFHPDEPEGACFMSAFVPVDDDASVGAEDIKHAFRGILEIIDQLCNVNTSTKDLIDAVESYYNANILQAYPSYGAWSRKSIFRFIFQHSAQAFERQATLNVKMVQELIQWLYRRTAVTDEDTGDVFPDLKEMRELENLIKLHSNLISEQKRRLEMGKQ